MRQNRSALEERIDEFNEIIEKIQGEPLPEPDGLSLDSRRLINIAILSLAQHLIVHFSEHDLARLAKTATKRTVADMKFGDRRVCDQMVERIRERIEELNRDRTLADQVKTRADMLINQLKYRHDSDATPMREGLSEVVLSPKVVAQGRTGHSPLRVNVLEDDFWDLSRSLH
jgi:hypothetical protein